MSRRETEQTFDALIQFRPAPAERFHGGVVGLEEQIFRLLLGPFEASFRTVDSELELVFFAAGDFAQFNDTLGALVKAQHDGGIIIQLTPFHKGGKIGGKFRDLQAGGELDELLGMGSDIPHTGGGAGHL